MGINRRLSGYLVFKTAKISFKPSVFINSVYQFVNKSSLLFFEHGGSSMGTLASVGKDIGAYPNFIITRSRIILSFLIMFS